MKTYDSYANLLEEIKKDRGEKSGRIARYAARLILLDSFDRFRDLVQDLNSEVIELSGLMEHDNYWFGPNKLIDIVKEPNLDAVIVPISEVIRFYDDAKFESFLATVLLMQNQGDRRIYIPLVGVKSRFEKFWRKFNRQSEGPPVWYLHSEMQELICVYGCKDDIQTKLTTITTNREWLDYWKTDLTTPLVTKTRSLISRWEEFLPNGCFDKDSIENSKEMLSKVLKLIFNRCYHSSEEKYWNTLLSECEAKQQLQNMFPIQILEKLLGIQDLTQYDDAKIMKIYLDSDRYARWLINTLLDQIGIYDSYFKNVISKLRDFAEYDLTYGLYFGIFDSDMHQNLDQRRDIIEQLPQDYRSLVDSFIDDWFDRLHESGLGSKLCTLYSTKEREFIIEDIAHTGDFAEIGNLYPQLAGYLDWKGIRQYKSTIESKFVDYFTEYTKAKVMNKVNTEFHVLFNRLNADKNSFYEWYYSVPELQDEKEYKIVQFDGVGAEWLPYILFCIEQYQPTYAKGVESCDLRRVRLPSITTLNRIEGAEFVKDYDSKVIHKSSGYSYPRSLIESLDLINEMIRIHVMISPENNICICADHGASFMCRKKFGAVTMHDTLEGNHEGRYYVGKKNIPDNEAFFNADNYFIAFKHHVISANVRREVHGGATPEEVLVPCVYVSKTEVGYQREYGITLSGHTLNFDSRILEIRIDPNPEITPEFWCDNKIVKPHLSARKYLLDLSNYEPDKYQIRIKINKRTYTESIEISSGYVEEDLFDE